MEKNYDQILTVIMTICGSGISIRKKRLIQGYSQKAESIFKLFLKMDQKYPYSAYEGRMYCIYLGYKYNIENIWHGLFILYPNERKREDI